MIRTRLAATIVAVTTLAIASAVRPASAEALGSLVQRCAPHVAPRTALAIISVESSGVWYAVNDNDRPTPSFASADDAIAYAERRVAEGGSIDLGLAQLNSSHLREFGVTVREAFEPCTNVALGMTVLQEAWASAQTRFGRTREALYRAFEAYNGGPGTWDTASPALRQKVDRYARTVWETAMGLSFVKPSTPALEGAVRVARVLPPATVVHRRIVVLDDVSADRGGM